MRISDWSSDVCSSDLFEFAIQHFETEIFGNRTVHAAQRIRIVEFLNLVNLAVLAVTEERRRVFALAVDADNCGFSLEAAQVIGTAGMCQVKIGRASCRDRVYPSV